MSGYKIHLLVYVVSFSVISFYVSVNHLLDLSFETLALSLFIGAVYSILPDMDMPSSLMRRFIEKALLFLLLALIAGYVFSGNMILIYAAIAVVLFLLILWYAKHRGFFHTLAAGFMASAPLFVIEPYFAFSAFLGFMAHLAVDGKMFALI